MDLMKDTGVTPLVEKLIERLHALDEIGGQAVIAEMEAAEEPAWMIAQMRGRVALMTRDWVSAHDHFHMAVHLNPDDWDSWICLASACYEMGLFEQSILHAREAAVRYPEHGRAWLKLGAAHALLQHHAEALACFERALFLSPNDAETHHSIGAMFSSMALPELALRHFRAAQQIEGIYVQSACGEAAELLRMGEWLEGWEKFEDRFRLPAFALPWWFTGQPPYTGDLDGLRGKRVLLWAEQGYGDSLQFSRYIPKVMEVASHVTIETHQPLERLFKSFGCEVTVHRRDAPPDVDVTVSLMSLPRLFGTTPENCPPPSVFDVEPKPQRAKIGVCWAGGARPDEPLANAIDNRRSIGPDRIIPVIEALGAGNWISLQQEDLPKGDWQDTANIVAGLDLVITVDTAMAHLAASLGVETWLLCRFDTCWRWGQYAEHTVWYPSMRIFRQRFLGDWGGVAKQVIAAIGERHAAALADTGI